MIIKALIVNGVVQELLTADPFPPFHADLTWVDVTALQPQPKAGDLWDGATFTTPPPDPEKVRVAALKADAQRIALMDALKAASPAQIDAYVDAQVTDLASVRALLKRILKLLAVSIR